MSAESEPVINRPKPSWVWRYEWRNFRRAEIHGRRSNAVRALFSGNEDPVEGGLPNEILIEHEAGKSRGSTIRMSREAAHHLVAQLQAALDWDGQ